MKYKDYTADDLIKDENFQEWVFSPTDETNKFWIEFLVKYPDHSERIEEARQFLSAFNIRDKDVFESRIRNLKRRIDQSIDFPEPAKHTDPAPGIEVTKRNTIWVKIAVFLALAIATAGLSFHYFKKEKVEVAPKSDVTARGERMAIVMDDGSKVWLNADSRLSYPENFGSGSRSVDLDGEAYFEIADSDQPFLIATAGMLVAAKNAAFKVKAHRDDSHGETALLRGSMTITSQTGTFAPVMLMARQGAVIRKDTWKVIVNNEIDPEIAVGWVNGVLSFEDQRLSDIARVLERWYDIDIHISADSNSDCRFSVRMDNQNLGQALEMLKNSGGIHYRTEGREIFVQDKLCHDQFIK